MRVVVFGSGFGVEHLTALRLEGKHEIVGLVARGSRRSNDVAAQFAVPLFSDLKEVAGAVDVACLAVRRESILEASRACFALGVDVLVEHPLESDDLETLLTSAAEHGRALHVSVLWSRLPHALEFVRVCKEMSAREPLLRLRGGCGVRLAYSLCDLLVAILSPGSLHLSTSLTVPWTTTPDGPVVQTCVGEMGGARLQIDVSYFVNRVDDGSDVLDGFELTASFPSGKVMLCGPNGPLLWSPHSAPDGVPEGARPSGTLGDRAGLLGGPPASWSELQYGVWGCIGAEITALESVRRGEGPPDHQTKETLIRVSQTWTGLVARNGPRPAPTDARKLWA